MNNLHSLIEIKMAKLLLRFIETGSKIQAGQRGGEVMGELSALTDEARQILKEISGE